MANPPTPSFRFYPRIGKRLFDASLVLLSLPVVLPVLAILAILVAIKLGRPVLFIQPRPGKNGKLFAFCKFRSMKEAYHPDGTPLPDAQRMTRFGSRLRASSLDELPSLYNVLKGDMSLVGPRPLLASYLPLYTKEQAKRHNVLPGITGLAQVNGRNAQSWDERFNWDLRYVETCTFANDLAILWRTIWSVIKKEGISAQGHATMPSLHEHLQQQQQQNQSLARPHSAQESPPNLQGSASTANPS